MAISLLLAGACAGALLMYFYDPLTGARRRHRLAAQFLRSRQAVARAGEDTRSEALANARRFPGTLSGRVHARLARVLQRPELVSVRARAGRVMLHGSVPPDELDPLLQAVKSTPGVLEIHERLTVRRGFAGAPGSAETRAEAWPPTVRGLTALAGGLLLVMWLGWYGFVTAVLGVIGAGLLIRAMTNTELRRVFGMNRPRRPSHSRNGISDQ
jgi:hypothetical protein